MSQFETVLPFEISPRHFFLSMQTIVSQKSLKQLKFETASIPIEYAEELFESISFTVRYYIDSNPELSHPHLESPAAFESFVLDAETFLKISLLELQTDFNQLKPKLYRLRNQAYEETVFMAIDGFFKYYDVENKAQDYVITADYPLLHEDRSLMGLSFMKRYIHCLNIEQSYLSAFSQNAIQQLINQYHRDSNYLIFNISEVLFFNSLLLSILHKDTPHIRFTKIDLEMLYVIFSNESEDRVWHILNHRFDNYMQSLQLSNPEVLNYYRECLKSMTKQLVFHCENESLDKFLVLT